MAYKGADLKQGDSMKTIYVCVGSSCHLKGSYDIIRALEKLIKQNHLENEVELKAEFCFGNCTKPVSVKIDDKGPYSVDKDRVEDFFRQNILGDN
jgi:NADH:ubiquinone oxidoreductase subunit E